MSTLTHDTPAVGVSRGNSTGLLLALVSAWSFGLSGSLARGLFDTGWSPGAVVLVRIGLAAVVLAPFGLRALRGRAGVVRRNLGLVLLYGLMAVAVAQFCYFSAVQHMQVGPAILIEYTAPAVVVLWMWLRHGHRPRTVTTLGAVLAAAGLVLVLDLIGGVALSTAGVLWALVAMLGAATYFVVNGDDGTGLPPIALAWLGLVVGGTLLAVVGVAGLMPLHAAGGAVALAGGRAPWWVLITLLGVVTAAVAYSTGVAAGRRLGSRLSSFVALFEVVASVVFAWVLLGELPHVIQLLGGSLILAGVVAVRLGEQESATVEATNPRPPA
jgi:drug/metabolite transporter (DMT)-like permease